MDKRTLQKELTRYANGGAFATRTQIARCIGLSNARNISDILVDLPRIKDKYYLISDVADRLIDLSEIKRR